MTNVYQEAKNERKTEFEIDPIFPARWSPRAMAGTGVSKENLMQLFEVARWAPSSYNNQPWRFIYVMREHKKWTEFFNLLKEGNRKWVSKAGALIIVISKKTFDHDGKFSKTHSFDTGAAWQNLALQGSEMGLVIHGIEGFDYKSAADLVELPEDYEIEMMIALGNPDSKEVLPDELAKKEQPNSRKSVEEIVFEGKFNTKQR